MMYTYPQPGWITKMPKEPLLGFSRTLREGSIPHAASTRWRKRSKLARPYMLRLISFKRLIWPSTCPFE